MASQERLEKLRHDIAAAQESLDSQKAEWQNEKDAIVGVQNPRPSPKALSSDEERATCEATCSFAPRFATRAFLSCSSSRTWPRKP